ncbi:helix-turn-helix domain-containing protein, partial [Heyndrickxia coagulans]
MAYFLYFNSFCSCPNKEQSALLAKTFGCVRFVYNK